jgi:hypothetical protein
VNREEYSKKAMEFAQYEDPMYVYWAALEELGEFAGKIAKSLRGDKELDMEALRKEAGDVLWQLNARSCEENSYQGSDPLYEEFIAIVSNAVEDDVSDWVARNFEYFIEDFFNMNPDEIRQENIDKLTDRKNRNAIKGDGDCR